MPGVSGCWLPSSCRLRRFSFMEPLWWRFMRSICSSTLIFTFVSLANTALFGLSWGGEPSPVVKYPCTERAPTPSARAASLCKGLPSPGARRGTRRAPEVPSWLLRCRTTQRLFPKPSPHGTGEQSSTTAAEEPPQAARHSPPSPQPLAKGRALDPSPLAMPPALLLSMLPAGTTSSSGGDLVRGGTMPTAGQRNTRLSIPGDRGAGSQPRAVLGKSWRPLCRDFPMARAGLGSLLEQDLQGQHRTFVESRLLLCLLLLPARWPLGGGSGGSRSLRLLLALLEARLGLRGQKRSPVSHDPAGQPHSAWEHTHTLPQGGHTAPDMLLGHTDAGQADHQHTQSVLLQRGHGLGGLCSSWPGTPQCPGDTAPCWKSFLQGDGPDTAWRGHPGAPGWRCPVLSSCPCLQEGTGSHEGRSWGRHWAAAGSEPRAVFVVLPLLHPEHALVTLTLGSIIIPGSAQLLFLQPHTHAS